MKTAIAIIIFFTIGLFSGKYFFSTNEVIVRTETIPLKSGADKQLESISRAFYNLSQKEFLEYTKLKDEKEKFEKADEILGKIILVFLATVKMKMQPEVKDYFVDGNRPEVNKPIIQAQDKAVQKADGTLDKNVDSDYTFKKYKAKNEEFQEAINKLPVEIKSPYAFFKKSKAIESLDSIKKFNGMFKGNLLIEKGKRSGEIHDVELAINFIQDGSKIKGSYDSKISFKGQLYSHNRGKGSNGKIKSAKKGFYLIEVSPNSFMHLNYLESEDYFVGKYYDNDEYSGLVKIYPIY